MAPGLETGDNSGAAGGGDAAGAAQPRQEVVVRTVREVKLRARWLWNAIDKGTDVEEDDMLALEAIIAAMPAEYRESLWGEEVC